MLKGKKILVGITGSIAAYKIAILVRLLIKEGAEVKIVMTPAAKDFITPLTLSTLSKHPVIIDLFDESSWANHVMLGRWADLFIIAPLSCNTLAKMSSGLCDNLLMAVYLSATCPVMVAPAMDEDMWKHQSTQVNLQTIARRGNIVLAVAHGELASGLIGEGRMGEPETIVEEAIKYLKGQHQLAGVRALVTAGPTYEALDPVRFIGNHSSGKMGIAIAKELKLRGAEVTVIAGPMKDELLEGLTQVEKVRSAEEMYSKCLDKFPGIQLLIMAAAVADYTPTEVSPQKIKKNDQEIMVGLKKTRDILAALGNIRKADQVLVGFALETENESSNAMKKMEDKNADMIILNSLNDNGAGFGHDTNKITIYSKKSSPLNFETKSKRDVAKDIVDTLIEYYYA